jgi:hypothetical protein
MIYTKQDKVYLAVTVLVAVLSIYLASEIIGFRSVILEERAQNPAKWVDIADFSDLWIVGSWIAVIFILRKLHYLLFKARADALYRPFNFIDQDHKTERLLHYQFSWIYYSISLGTAFYLYYDHPNIYYWVGGKSVDFKTPVLNWPRTLEPLPYAKYFLLINMGTHAHNLMNHVFNYTYVKNYMEMTMHH